jgi:hypothetical protein
LNVQTLFVFATRRDAVLAADHVKAIQWACSGTNYTIVMDRGQTIETLPGVESGFAVVQLDVPGAAAGFACGVGLRWAIDQGYTAEQVVILADTCLPIGQGLDSWALQTLQSQKAGLLGVVDRLNFEPSYTRCTAQLAAWHLPYTLFSPGDETVHEAILIAPWLTVTELYRYNLLTPAGCEHWPLTYGAYISWATQMLGCYLLGWGHMLRPLPPLFVASATQPRCLPAPQILSDRFLAFADIRQIGGYSEAAVRLVYQQRRGESVAVPQQSPVLIPRQPDG